MNAARAMNALSSSPLDSCSSQAARGKSAAAATLASDTYPVVRTSTAHTTVTASSPHGASARTTPAAVATPFPPLNPTKIEKTWPRTAASPQSSGKSTIPGSRGPKSQTGRAPLRMSMRPTGIAYFQPRMR